MEQGRLLRDSALEGEDGQPRNLPPSGSEEEARKVRTRDLFRVGDRFYSVDQLPL